jgi:hypothetical protein
MTRTTTIEQARQRLEMAEIVADDLNGRRKNEIDVVRIGDYTVVDDGESLWLATTRDIDSTIREIVGAILDGYYDQYIPLDLDGGRNLGRLLSAAYSALCQDADVIYESEDGDLDGIAALGEDPTTLRDLLRALGIKEKYEEYVASDG